jgi:hypothetical protein
MLDTFAKELDARVHIPDFFDGSPVPLDVSEARKNFDLKQIQSMRVSPGCEVPPEPSAICPVSKH